MGCTESGLGDTILHPRSHNLNNSPYGSDTPFQDIALREQIITDRVLQEHYERANGDFQVFLNSISACISRFYMYINTQILEQMNIRKLNATQSKVLLSWKSLIMSLNILRFLGNKTDYRLDLSVFKKFSKMQRSLIGYLQMKYPRGGKGFVPGELMSVFKNFSMVENPENDILRNAGVAFTDPTTAAIIKKLKEFFNKIIDELDLKFPVFQSFMIDSIFGVEDETGAKKTLPYKIGRKIPETVSKYVVDQEQGLTISNPEIFRIIIKWIDDMDDFLLNPDEEIYEKFSFKTIFAEQDGMVKFDVLYPDDFESFTTLLKEKLGQLKGEYRQYINSLRDEMNIFNMNLIKILEHSKSKQKYIPKDDVRVIKYAMFTTKLVSWILVQKLIFILQCLINVGKHFESSGPLRRVDLIKFNVTDLMRSMVKGSKKQLLKVYENMRKHEQLGNLKIIKIKNRLATPLNDAMIIFTVKESFLICQLQLVLTENETKTQRLKNIEFLNHFLYELERTPYGVLSELAVVIGFKDNKVNYEDKIELENTKEFRIQECEKNHRESVDFMTVQDKPFICSSCTLFYHPFENIFALKTCKKCYTFECCRCIFGKDKMLEEELIDRRFNECLHSIIFTDKNRKKLGRTLLAKDVLTVFRNQKIWLCNIMNSSVLKPKDLHKFVKEKKYLQVIKQKNPSLFEKMQYEDSAYFLLVNFKSEGTQIKLMFWNLYISELQNSYEQEDNIYTKDNLISSFYDFLIFLDTSMKEEVAAEKMQDKVLIDLHKKDISTLLHQKSVRMVEHIPIENKQKVSLVLRVQIAKRANLDGYEVDEAELLTKKEFLYETIDKARRELPEIKIARENILMRNMGLTNYLLKELCTETWRQQIQILNISDNKITEISIVFQYLPNLKQLIASKNFIAAIDISKPMQALEKLICFNNKITKFSGFANAPNILFLNLNRNNLGSLFKHKVSLPLLTQLSIAQNQFHTLENMSQKCEFPCLEILNMHQLNKTGTQSVTKSFQVPFIKLKKLMINENQIDELIIDSQNLQNLEGSNCQIKHLVINSPNIKILNLSRNVVNNFEKLLSRPMPNLQKLNLNYVTSKQFKKLPKMDCPKLKQFSMENSDMEDISAMTESPFHHLQILCCSDTKIQVIPEIEAPMLSKLDFYNCELTSIEKLSIGSFPFVTDLELKGQWHEDISEAQSVQFPKLQMAKLQCLTLQEFKFQSLENFAQSQCSQIKQLTLQRVRAPSIPRLNLPKLDRLIIRSSYFTDIEKLQTSHFQSLTYLELATSEEQSASQTQNKLSSLHAPNLKEIYCEGSTLLDEKLVIPTFTNLQRISLSYSKLQKLPILNLPQLENLTVNYSEIKDISNLSNSNLSNISCLNFYFNEFLVKVPRLNFPKLKEISFSDKISNLEQFQQSYLPELTDLDISQNQFKQFPPMSLPKLKNLSFYSSSFLISLAGLKKCDFPCLENLYLSYCSSFEDISFPIISFPSLIELEVSGCNLTNFEGLERSSLPKLQRLTIDQCPVANFPVLNFEKLSQVRFSNEYSDESGRQTEISSISKWKCPNLQTFTLERFKFTSFPTVKMENMTTLRLMDNDLESLNSFEMNNLPKLSQIQITGSPKLHSLFLIKKQLKKLVLDSNSLKNLNFLEGSSIECIEVNNNQIENLDKINLQKTVSFSANENLIKDISALKSAPFLSQLSLISNQICEFPQFRFPLLENLSLSNNKLVKFNIRKDCCPLLSYLHLDNNSIAQIKELNCPSLTYCDISDNSLTQICCFESVILKESCDLNVNNNKIKKILSLPKMNSLSLSKNELKEINWLKDKRFIQSICLLESFDVSNNQIQSIDFSTVAMPKLNYLNLEGNKITQLQIMDPKCLPFLSSLEASNNLIKTLSLYLPSIYSVNLNNNQISIIKSLIITTAYTLQLSNNKIGDMEWLKNIESPSLCSLYLSNNEIQEVKNLHLLRNLTSLNLEDNPLCKVTFKQSDLPQLKEKLVVSINSNKISDKAVLSTIKAQLEEIALEVDCQEKQESCNNDDQGEPIEENEGSSLHLSKEDSSLSKQDKM